MEGRKEGSRRCPGLFEWYYGGILLRVLQKLEFVVRSFRLFRSNELVNGMVCKGIQGRVGIFIVMVMDRKGNGITLGIV